MSIGEHHRKRAFYGNKATEYEFLDSKSNADLIKRYDSLFSKEYSSVIKGLERYKEIEEKISKEYGNKSVDELIKNNNKVGNYDRAVRNNVNFYKEYYQDSPYRKK